MNSTIESIEARVLLSASNSVIAQDFSSLRSDAATTKSDLKAAVATLANDAKALKAAFAAAHPTGTQRQLGATLQRDKTVVTNAFTKQINSLLGPGIQVGERLLVQLKALLAHPTNTAAHAKVTSTLAALQGVFSTQKVAAAEGNMQSAVTTLDNDLNALASAVPSTQSQVATTESDVAASLSTLSNELSKIQTSIARLQSDVG